MRRKNFYIARIDKEIEKETKEQNKSGIKISPNLCFDSS